MNQYERMEKDIQSRIKKVIKDKETYSKITDIPKSRATFYDLDIEMDYYAWPGGYPLYYIVKDCDVLCPKCVNENIELLSDEYDPQWYLIGVDINYEDTDLYCDHCGEQIEPAYEQDDDEETGDDE